MSAHNGVGTLQLPASHARMSSPGVDPKRPTFFCRTRDDIVLPFSRPIKGSDGKDIHEVLVPKNTDVVVSILSANRNLEIWGEDALQWKPERWLSALPQSVTNAQIPGVYSHL